MSIRDLLFTTVYPGLIAGVGLLASWLLWQVAFRSAPSEATPRGPLWVAPVVFTLAFLVAYYGFNPKPQLWPSNAVMRLHATAAAGGAVGVLAALAAMLPARFRWGGHLARHALALALGAFIALAYLAPLTPHALSAPRVAVLAVASAIWLAITTAILDSVAHRLQGWRMPAALLPLVGGSVPVFLFGAYATGAQFAGTLIALLSAALVVGLICRRLSLERGGVIFVMGVLLSLGLIAYFFNSNSRTGPLILLALAPIAAGVSLLPAIADRKGLLPFLAAFAPMALVAGAAALWAFLGRPDLDPYPY